MMPYLTALVPKLRRRRVSPASDAVARNGAISSVFMPYGNGGRGSARRRRARLEKAKAAYGHNVSIIKDTLDVAWKLAPLAFLPSSLFLWIYLRAIQWTTIFQDTAMTGSGLIFLFVAALLLAFAVLLQFVAPSLVMNGAASYYDKGRLVPKAVPRLYLCAMGGWVVGWAIAIASDIDRTWLALALPFVLALSYAVVRRKDLEFDVRPGAWQYAWTFHALLLAAVATLTMWATSAPLLLGIDVVEPYAKGALTETVVGILLCIGTSIVSLLPGFMYLHARTRGVGNHRAMKYGLFGGFLTAYAVLTGVSLFVPVASTVLRIAGVYSNERQNYQLREPKLAGELSAVGLPVKLENGVASVSAYLRYGFGGSRLLCRDKLLPSALDDSAIQEALRKKQPDPRAEAGSGCVVVASSELRPFKP